MSAGQTALLKIRVLVPEEPPTICILGLEVDFARQLVKPQSAAVSKHESFRSAPLGAEADEFRAWMDECRYYDRIDKPLTVDVERHIRSLIADERFVSDVLKAAQTSGSADIAYDLTAGLAHILGSSKLRVESHVVDGVAAPRPNEGGGPAPLPLQFVMAPMNGVPLLKMPLNRRVVARFADLKDERVKQYLARRSEAGDTGPLEVVLTALREAPEAGPEAIRAAVELPGGVAGEVLEENRYIRVRVADSSGPGAQAPATPQAVSFSGRDVPAWVIFAASAFVMVIVVAALWIAL